MGLPALRQVAACAVAVDSTHRPMWSINPLRSAMGMNRSGPTGPRSGWVQRHRASTASVRPESMLTIGW